VRQGLGAGVATAGDGAIVCGAWRDFIAAGHADNEMARRSRKRTVGGRQSDRDAWTMKLDARKTEPWPKVSVGTFS